jgi:EmrB/QacA subfamily drug resistance transporter
MSKDKKERLGLIMALYLLGLFIGALSTGIITPARTIIQGSLGVDDQTGIWMITIFTLSYAAIIPVAGKLADRYGRKKIYLASMALFGLGTLIAGLSSETGSFAILLAGRVIQAAGAGGIMPIATAEFGTSFPEEKRGMALGLVGGVYGIANVLAATAGSAILDIFGTEAWDWIFYINLPFCVLIILAGLFLLPDHKGEVKGRIDILGTLFLTVIILSLLYGLRNLDFFDFAASIGTTEVWPFLVLAAALIPLFVFVEKQAQDPIFHMEYMGNSRIVVVLAMSFLVGASMMGMIFIPQFAENSLGIPTGDGGYFVIILGFVAGLISPVSGVIIDRFGAKVVLGAGFLISVIGSAWLVFVAAPYPGLFNVILSLVLVGLGMGLSMGTPLNYMMLSNTPKDESNAALATLSLIRSVGTAIAPAIMVGFLVQAGMTMQPQLMAALPDLPEAPVLTEQVKLQGILDELAEANPDMADQLASANMDLSGQSMSFDDMSGSGSLPDDLVKSLQTADVTNIVERTKNMAAYMFGQNIPGVVAEIQDGIGQGILGMQEGIDGVSTGISQMQAGLSELDSKIAGLNQGIAGLDQGIAALEVQIRQMAQAIEMAESGGGMPGYSAPGMPAAAGSVGMPADAGTGGMPGGEDPAAQLEALKAAKAAMEAKLQELMAQQASMGQAVAAMSQARIQLDSGLADAEHQKALMLEAKALMETIRDKIPGVFDQMEADYLVAIDQEGPAIEKVFQSTLNDGFADLFLCVMIFNAIGVLVLLFYREPKNKVEAAR